MVPANGRRIPFLLAALVLVLLNLLLAPARAAEQAGGEAVQAQLKAAVQNHAKGLQGLETWQTQLVDEEIVPQYSRFVRDYRPSGTGLAVEIDQESVKRYLTFYGPKVLRSRDYRFLVAVRAEAGCDKCQKAAADLKSVVKSRLEHRGLTPVFVGGEDLTDPTITGKALEDLLVEQIRQRQSAGVIVIQAQNAPRDDEDAGHADEKRYQLRVLLQLREINTARYQGQMELLANDSFDVSFNRLITDAWTEIGAKTASFVATNANGEAGVLLEVFGFKDYAMFNDIRTKLAAGLKDVASLDERKIQRGRVWLLAATSKNAEDLRRQIAGLGLKGFVEVR